MKAKDIKKIRTVMGYTQAEFGALMGFHRTAIERMENGRIPVSKRLMLEIQVRQFKKKLDK